LTILLNESAPCKEESYSRDFSNEYIDKLQDSIVEIEVPSEEILLQPEDQELVTKSESVN
jgi:hypothetical protein